MLQKLKTRVSCKLTYALLLCAVTTSQSFAQSRNDAHSEQTLFKTDSDTSQFDVERIVINENDIKNVIPHIENNIVSPTVGLYEVKEEMTSFYSNPKEIEKLEKAFEDFENENRSKKRFGDKTIVEEYNDKINYANNLQTSINGILKYIDEYNSSKERYKNKIHLLKEAQELADNVKLKIVVEKPQKYDRTTTMQPKPIKQELRLYYDKSRVFRKRNKCL